MGHKRKRKLNCARRVWIEANGDIPEGFHIHHKVPLFAGGTDDISNLCCLGPEEHQQAHLKRYEEFGDVRDLCSYYMLTGCYHEAHLTAASEGGKIGGALVKKKGIGIFKYDRTSEEYKKMAAKGGSAAQETLKRLGISAFYDKELKKEICRKGGLASPVFKDPKRQSEFGKRGGVKNKGFRWYNDGAKVMKYTVKMQSQMSFEDFLSKTGFFRGRLGNAT